MTPAALDRPTIERALRHSDTLSIALSGGGDSVALLHLLTRELGPARLRAVVVDHGLRAGSAADARRGAGFAEALGVRAEVRDAVWSAGAKRTQAGARAARYRALCAGAERVIVLAHTCDDQAETLMMRAAAGSGWRGLAGMAAFAPAPIWPEGRGVVLARPLLGVRREALRVWLRANLCAWIEDPANSNAAFERVRVRARLTALEDHAVFDPRRLGVLALRLRAHAEHLDALALALVARAARFEDEHIHLDREAWEGDVETRRRALSALIAAAAGAAHEPAPAALARLEARLCAPSFRGAALGGARVSAARGALMIGRDLGALQGRAGGPGPAAPVPLPPNVETVWDGRVVLRAAEPGWAVALADGAPVLMKGAARAPLAAAAPHWLIKTHARHLLGAVD